MAFLSTEKNLKKHFYWLINKRRSLWDSHPTFLTLIEFYLGLSLVTRRWQRLSLNLSHSATTFFYDQTYHLRSSSSVWDSPCLPTIKPNILCQTTFRSLVQDQVWRVSERLYLGLDSIISEAQVLQICSRVGLHWGEVMLQHVNHLCQLRVTPGKLSANRWAPNASSWAV